MEKNPVLGQGAVNSNENMAVLTIYVNKKTRQVSVNGLLSDKKLCLNALGEAVKCVANFESSKIIKPSGGLMNRMARFFHR